MSLMNIPGRQRVGVSVCVCASACVSVRLLSAVADDDVDVVFLEHRKLKHQIKAAMFD